MIFFYLVLMIMCLFDFRSSCFSLIFHFRAGFFFCDGCAALSAEDRNGLVNALQVRHFCLYFLIGSLCHGLWFI